ncbi:MAG: hypothetical protein ACR2MS_00860 [Weeksellaceae bacterium]
MRNSILVFITLVLSNALFAGGPNPGGNPEEVPVDNYIYILIAIAMLIIGYVVYKKKQAKIA